MMKYTLVFAPLCIGLVWSANAQDAMLPSTALMKQQQTALYRNLQAMVKGDAPFSADVAKTNVAHLIETSHKIPAAFPESLKGKASADSRYATSPKAWEQRADFEAKATVLLNELKATEASFATLDGLKAAYPRVNEACNGCHEVYRVRR